MEPAPIPPQPSKEHTTIVTLSDASGDSYCALTLIHRDGDQRHCAISRRIGSHEPSFGEAMHYAQTNLYASRKPNSIRWIDHEFEVLANFGLLHRFETVQVTAMGDISREKVDLTMYQVWAACVQPAVRLLLKIGA